MLPLKSRLRNLLFCERQARYIAPVASLRQVYWQPFRRFWEIARCHLGRFGRNFWRILPTSLPEFPMQLTDLRNNQKSWKTNFSFSIQNPKFRFLNLEFGFQTFEPVLGRKFHVESEFEVHSPYLWAPEGKIQEKRKLYKFRNLLLFPLYSLYRDCIVH